MRVSRAVALVAIGLVVASLSAAPATAQSSTGLAIDTDCDELVCTFTARNASAAVSGEPTSYNWTIQPIDVTGTGPVLNHTFDDPGTFDVTVNVTGTNGTAQHTETVEVTADRVDQSAIPWSALGFGVVALIGSLVLARLT